jgi:hypothetical protein
MRLISMFLLRGTGSPSSTQSSTSTSAGKSRAQVTTAVKIEPGLREDKEAISREVQRELAFELPGECPIVFWK